MEIQRVQTYKCYYCATKFDTINNIVEHCQEKHQQNVLKYRQLILDESSDILKYQTKLHKGIVPRELEKSTGAWGMNFVSSSPLSLLPPFKIFIIIRFSSFDNVFIHLTISVDVIHHE